MTLVAAVAIYAAILSTLMAVRTFWLERDQLKVTFFPGKRKDIEGGSAVIDIQNRGRRPAFIYSVRLVTDADVVSEWEHFRFRVRCRFENIHYGSWSDGDGWNWADEHTFPTTIEPGASLTLWLPETELADWGDHIMVAEVRDQLQRSIYSNPYGNHSWRS